MSRRSGKCLENVWRMLGNDREKSGTNPETSRQRAFPDHFWLPKTTLDTKSPAKRACKGQQMSRKYSERISTRIFKHDRKCKTKRSNKCAEDVRKIAGTWSQVRGKLLEHVQTYRPFQPERRFPDHFWPSKPIPDRKLLLEWVGNQSKSCNGTNFQIIFEQSGVCGKRLWPCTGTPMVKHTDLDRGSPGFEPAEPLGIEPRPFEVWDDESGTTHSGTTHSGTTHSQEELIFPPDA